MSDNSSDLSVAGLFEEIEGLESKLSSWRFKAQSLEINVKRLEGILVAVRGIHSNAPNGGCLGCDSLEWPCDTWFATQGLG